MDAQTPTNGVCPVGKTPFCRLPCGENAFKVQGTPMKRHLIGGPSTKPNMLRCYPLQQVLQHAMKVRERQF